MKPALSMPEASAKVAAAAAAVGLNPLELAELALAVAPPTQQTDLTVTASLRDVGEHLYRRLNDQGEDIEKRRAFFESLAQGQRETLVLWLAERGFAPATIAQLGMSESKIRSLWIARSEDLGKLVQGVSLSALVGAIQSRYEQCIELAQQAGDYKAVMSFEEKRVTLLQSLGVVEQAVQRHTLEVTHKIEDAMQHELDRILELREKAKVRAVAWEKQESYIDAEVVQ